MARVGRPCKPRKPPSTPLQAMIEEYIESLAARGFAYNTYNVRRGHLYLFERWAMERGLSEPVEVTRPVLERFQRYLFHYRKKEGGPLSFSSQHSRLSSLRMWFRWMTRQNYLLHNPASEIELPRLSKSLPHVLTAAEAELILQQPNAADPLGIRDRAMLEMFYSTGMRRMELIRLRLYDVDRVSGIVTIREGKGRKDRVIPIGARAVAWLEKYLDQARHRLVAEPDEGTIFLTVQGEPFTPNRLSGLIGGYVEAAGTGKSGACHLFRHTMATLMLEGGADIRFIQQMLGHARLDSTQIYTHVSIRMLKQIHSATHPAAQLKRNSEPSADPEVPEEAVESATLAQTVPGQMWPGVPASTAEQLFAALDAESAEEEQE